MSASLNSVHSSLKISISRRGLLDPRLKCSISSSLNMKMHPAGGESWPCEVAGRQFTVFFAGAIAGEEAP